MRGALRRCGYASVLLIAAYAAGQQSPENLFPRAPYTVPLAKLSVSLDDANRKVERVRVSYEGSDDYVNLGPINDEYVKMTRRGRETTVYREPWESAVYVSDFEAEHLQLVTQTLISTLEGFEGDLKKGNWERIHYLDGYLPRFLRGFYYLCDAVVCGQDGLPRVARVPETAFDVSLVSAKTDVRVAAWRKQTDHVIKLRIAAKELVYQLQRWEKASQADPQRFFDSDVNKAYSLFIRVYFNLNPPAKVPADGDHF